MFIEYKWFPGQGAQYFLVIIYYDCRKKTLPRYVH